MRTVAHILAALSFALGCGTSEPTPATPDAAAAPPAASTSAAPAAPARAFRGTTVALPSADGKASGYLSLPKEPGKHPAIIVIQEWWGLNDWIKENTDRFADQGYVALAVDLYRGAAASDADTAHQLMRGLPEDRAIGDLEAGFAFLAAHAGVDPARIGAVGWCMGGGYALGLAVAEPRLKASVINYGRLVTDPAAIGKIKASILGDFAGQDKGIPVDSVRDFDKALRAAGKDADIKIYDGAGHAFMNPNNAKGYDAAATKDAWSRIDAFFARKLKNG